MPRLTIKTSKLTTTAKNARDGVNAPIIPAMVINIMPWIFAVVAPPRIFPRIIIIVAEVAITVAVVTVFWKKMK